MAIALVQHQAGGLALEVRGKRTTLLAHGTPLPGEHSRLNGCPGSLSHYKELQDVYEEVRQEVRRMRPNTRGRVPWPDDIPSMQESFRLNCVREAEEDRQQRIEDQLRREQDLLEDREQDRLDQLAKEQEGDKALAGWKHDLAPISSIEGDGQLHLRISGDRLIRLSFPDAGCAQRFLDEFEEGRGFNGWNQWYLVYDIFYYGLEWPAFAEYHRRIADRYKAAASSNVSIIKDIKWSACDEADLRARYELVNQLVTYIPPYFNYLYFAEAEYISPQKVHEGLPGGMPLSACRAYFEFHIFKGDLINMSSNAAEWNQDVRYLIENGLLLSDEDIHWSKLASLLSYRQICHLLRHFGGRPERDRVQCLNRLLELAEDDVEKQGLIRRQVESTGWYQVNPPSGITFDQLVDAKAIAWALSWALKCYDDGELDRRDIASGLVLSG